MLRNGQTFGSYRIQSLLGRGAMGMVYQGIGLHDGEPVAIKTLRSELLTGPERDAILARFRREAQIGMRLKHPCIVRGARFRRAG
jgi:serine/threonine protein kinase